METVTLRNGVQIPMMGFGVYQIPENDTEACVLDAIEVGYRSFDTAQAYRNEEMVGNSVIKSGIPRQEFFLTTKVWITNAGYEKAKASIDESLRKLQTDYIDLLMVHQPFGDYLGSWKAIEEAYKAGKARAIGVCNFYPDRFMDIVKFSEIAPMVNQVEVHVFQQQKTARKYLDKYETQIEAWGPFARGANNMFTNPVLVEIGKRHGKTAGQIALRFLIQSGVVVIPKSVHKERMAENFNIFDFILTIDEMQQIEALDTGNNILMDHRDPDSVEAMFAKINL